MVFCLLQISAKPGGYSKEQAMMGRFILASNDTTVDPNTCLEYYKEQNAVERGFRFIKGNSFHASEVYLENSNRVAALSMIMVLCLLVYSFTEWVVRETLKIEKKQIRDQKENQLRDHLQNGCSSCSEE